MTRDISVELKSREDFNRLKTQSNVVKTVDHLKIAVFRDKSKVKKNPDKIYRSTDVTGQLNAIPTPEIALTYTNKLVAENYLRAKKIVEINWLDNLKMVMVWLPEGQLFENFKTEILSSGIFIACDQSLATDQTSSGADNFGDNWVFDALNMQGALDAAGDKTLTIGCLDGHGIVPTHPDIAANVTGTWDAFRLKEDVTPLVAGEKHGMACVGLYGAVYNNSLGIRGLGRNFLKIRFARISTTVGSGGTFGATDRVFAEGINNMMSDPNVRVITMSFGSSGGGPLFNAAIQAARAKDIIIIASAGNSSINNSMQYPAAFAGVISAYASDTLNKKAGFSNFGLAKDFAVAAPGVKGQTVDIQGAGGYVSSGSHQSLVEDYNQNFSGTSMSAPVLAAVAGHMIRANKGITEAGFKNALKAGCRKLGGYVYGTDGRSAELGYGIPDAGNCVQYAKGFVPPVPKHNFTGGVNSKQRVQQGTVQNVDCTIFTNRADIAAATASYRVYLSTNNLLSGDDALLFSGSMQVGNGAPSATQSFSYTVPSGEGNRWLIMVVDPEGAIEETNELDNTTAFQIYSYVADGGDFMDAKITALPVVFSADRKTALVIYEIENTGGAILYNHVDRKGKDLGTGGYNQPWNFKIGGLKPGEKQKYTTTVNLPVSTNEYCVRIELVNGVPDAVSGNNEVRFSLI
jgi:hypothetical protein